MKKDPYTILSRNKKAYHEYEIEDKFEAGIVLFGSEVKSLREKSPSIVEAYAKLEDGEIFLVGCHIPEFKQAALFGHDPNRKRKLLLHKREIKKIKKCLDLKGYTLVPLKIYFNKRNFVKVEIGLGKGKKLYDKRESLKKKSDKKKMFL